MNSDNQLQEVVVTETGGGKFMNRAEMGGHAILADEPRSAGGTTRGLPRTIFCSSVWGRAPQ
jgi:hypothetical protein